MGTITYKAPNGIRYGLNAYDVFHGAKVTINENSWVTDWMLDTVEGQIYPSQNPSLVITALSSDSTAQVVLWPVSSVESRLSRVKITETLKSSNNIVFQITQALSTKIKTGLTFKVTDAVFKRGNSGLKFNFSEYTSSLMHLLEPLDPLNPPLSPVNPPLNPIEPPFEPVGPPFDPVNPPIQPINPPIQPVSPPLIPLQTPFESIEQPLIPLTDPSDKWSVVEIALGVISVLIALGLGMGLMLRILSL